MKKTSAIFLISALTLMGASAAIVPSLGNGKINETRADGEKHVSTWDDLKEGVKNASSNDTFVLDDDITSGGGGSDRIKIDGKTDLTIDLNGHTVNRNRDSSSDDGHAFEIQGNSSVTITNTSGSVATITGGHAKNGGAINIHDGSSATLNNITITGNKANVDGGAISTSGTLIMTNCVIDNNEAGDTGGAIFATGKSLLTLTDCMISNNTADDDGGAINSHVKYASTIDNCTITGNKSKTEDGGGISHSSSGVTLTINNSTISNNIADDYGGGIDVEEGTVLIYGTTISGNKAEKGAGVYADDVFEAHAYEETPSLFSANVASNEGGAIYNNNDTVQISDTNFRENKSSGDGGALRLKDGSTSLTNANFTDNESTKGDGGAIYLGNDGQLTINGGSYTGNISAGDGGAICVDNDADWIKMSGAVVIRDNGAVNGNNLHLRKNMKLTVTGSLEGSVIGVSKYGETGVFTTGFKDNNPDVAPSSYFFSSTNAHSVGAADGGEAEIKSEGSGSVADPKLLFPFTEGSEVVRNSKILTGFNWMSGISGERYLNEINIPGTHDTAMRSIGAEAGLGSFMSAGAEYAITQKRYIPEQFEGGVRYVDIRLNNRTVTAEHTIKKNEVTDDGVHLWQCHGKTDGGTYWAEDAQGNLLHVGMVLDYARNFLERNPSECIVMGFSDETYYSKYVPAIFERLLKILTEYNAAYPDIFYLENGDITQQYTTMPKLKDVRGKILIECKKGYGIGGFLSYGAVTDSCRGQKTDKSAEWDEKVEDVNNFFKDANNQYDLPKDGSAWEHAGQMFKIGLNCAPTNFLGLPWGTPIYHSDRVLEKLFWKESGCFYDIKGKYVGWVKTDGATELEWAKIYRSNFWQDAEDYCTITVQPNLNDDAYQMKEYTVLKNSTITVPYFNYDYNQAANTNYFCGWTSGDDNYLPGMNVEVTGDMIFAAKWSKSQATTTTMIDVAFQDCDDEDNLRPDSVGFTVNGLSPVTVTEALGWHYEFTGAVSSIVPTWDKATANNDGEGTYRYTVSGDTYNGYVITFIHTNNTLVESISGSIIWDDNANYDAMRPAATSDIKVGLMRGGVILDSSLTTLSVNGTDSNKWDYTIPSVAPKYVDGKFANYSIVVENVNSWAHFAAYNFAQDGNNLIAQPYVNELNISVNILWDDGDYVSRPESVKVAISGDGELLSTETLSGSNSKNVREDWDLPDEENAKTSWMGSFAVNKYRRVDTYTDPASRTPIESYSIAVTGADGNPISGYDTPVITKVDDHTFDVTIKKTGEATHSDAYEAVVSQIAALGDIEYTPEYKASLVDARAAFDALDAEDKPWVSNYFKLVYLEFLYETTFARLIDLDARIEAALVILPTLPFSEVNDAVRDITSDLLDLTTADRNKLWTLDDFNAALLEIANTIAIVYQNISAIGEVSYPDSASAITTARTSYDALDADQKALVDNYDLLEFAEADYFAKYFLSATGTICATDGESANHATALNGIWDDLRSAWNSLSSGVKDILKNAETDEESILDFQARYSHIVNRYGDSFKFANGPTVSHESYYVTNPIMGASAEWPIALIVAISSSALIAGTLFFLLKRKRSN